MTVATSRALGSWPMALLKVSRATVGSVMPASVNSPMSAGMPCRVSNACRQLRAPAPPVEISVPSMSNRTACGSSTGASLTVVRRAVRVPRRPVARRQLRARDHPRPGRGVRLDRGLDLAPLRIRLRRYEPLGISPHALAPALDQLEPAEVVERVPARVRDRHDRVVLRADGGDDRLVGVAQDLVDDVVVGLARLALPRAQTD